MLALVLGLAGWFGWQSLQRSAYEQAVAWLPESTLRATWTDWAQVRDLAGGDALGGSPTSREVSAFLDRAYDLDLTSTSAVVGSAYAMEEKYGFSPLTAEWEMYGQSREGAVAVLRLGESVDLEAVESALADLGYDEPSGGRGSGGVWAATIDLVATIDPALTSVMQHVVVLPEERVVLLSDSQSYASSSAEVVTGSAEGLDEVEGTSSLAESAGTPVSSVLFASDFACEALSMAAADDEDVAVAEELVDAAGGVSPLAGLVVAMAADRSVVVGMWFEDADQASDDLRPRVELASGDAPGQGGTFDERFRVVEAASEGNEIVMQLEPATRETPLISDLTQGPLLFAAC